MLEKTVNSVNSNSQNSKRISGTGLTFFPSKASWLSPRPSTVGIGQTGGRWVHGGFMIVWGMGCTAMCAMPVLVQFCCRPIITYAFRMPHTFCHAPPGLHWGDSGGKRAEEAELVRVPAGAGPSRGSSRAPSDAALVVGETCPRRQ